MQLNHIALWCRDLERSRAFYCNYFGAQSNDKYINASKGFSSYFLTFEHGARLELMASTQLAESLHAPRSNHVGLAHFALSVGSAQAVDLLTQHLQREGIEVIDGPRHTGDGYYESVVLDPDGNRIEITI